MSTNRHRFTAIFLAVLVMGCGAGSAADKPGTDDGSDNTPDDGQPAPGDRPSDPPRPGGDSGMPPFADDQPPGPPAVPVEGDLWSDPATWGGRLPAAGDKVTIPAGRNIVVDVDPPALAGLIVRGTLLFAPRDVALASDFIAIERGGRLQLGTAQAPFEHRATITLGGPQADEGNFGSKVLSVLDGILDIHGAPVAHSWTKLDREAARGATEIVLWEAPGWQAGDRIVIAPSSPRMQEHEVAVIAAIDGKRVKLQEPLQYAHFGQVRMVGDETVDVRAEVGLLTRNIVIQGDAASTSQRVGAHMMFMAAREATVRLSNFEITRAGQFNRLGRYPIHFHIMEDRCKGCFVKHVSVHDTIQRGIVVHDTTNVLVADNVVFNTVGHNVIVETETTAGNAFRHNLALVNSKPEPTFTVPALVAQNDDIPGAFWIKNARNEFTDNAAAASVGIGFFFDDAADGPLLFQRNTAHAAMGQGAERDFIIQSGFLLMCGSAGQSFSAASKVTDVLVYQNGVSGFWPEQCTKFEAGMKPFEISRVQMVDNYPVNLQLRNQQDFFAMSDALFTEDLLGGGNHAVAIHFQYGGTLNLTRPTFAHMPRGGVFGTNDILGPWIARMRIEGARFIDADKNRLAQFPESNGLIEALDDSYLPKGAYTATEGTNPTLAAPGCTSKPLEDMELISCPTAPVMGFLVINQGAQRNEEWTAHGEPMHTLAPLSREDGARFIPRDYGFGGYEIVANTGLTYRLDQAPKGVVTVHFSPMGDVTRGLDDTAVVDVDIALPQAPRALYRSDANDSAEIAVDPAKDKLTAANSLNALAQDPLSHYFYDAGKGRLHLKANHRSIVIEP